jgi:hypothetical protein
VGARWPMNFVSGASVARATMNLSADASWPCTFRRGAFVRLRDELHRYGVILGPGEQPDEWRVGFVDGERDVYLSEHLEAFEPTGQQVRVVEGRALPLDQGFR